MIDDVWYSCNLGDAMLADSALGRIEARARAEFANAVNTDQCAVYYRHESEGRLHCELVLYFSPLAARMPMGVELQACAKPVRQDLSILVGKVSSWSLLFPDS